MFFGWRVVAGSFVAMMLVLGFFTYSFSLFVTPLREEFGVGLEPGLGGSCGNTEVAGLSPLVPCDCCPA